MTILTRPLAIHASYHEGSMQRTYRLAIISLFITLSTKSIAEDSDDAIVAATLRVTPMEHAGSHGPVGTSLGVGATQMNAKGGHPMLSLTDKEHETTTMQKVMITKGIMSPIDVGLALSELGEGKLGQAYVQATLYEAFAMPAFALRAGYSRLMSHPTAAVDQKSIDAILSFGFRFITAYGSVGFAQNTWEQTTNEDALSDESYKDVALHTWNSSHRAFGLQVAIVPPFVSIATEMADHVGQKTISAKLAVGI